MIPRLKQLNQAGDTIVEVLIVMAVLGLAFSISLATANKGLTQSRNAEEHSEALGIINSQVELVRAAFANNPASVPSVTANSFCMSNPADTTKIPLLLHRYSVDPNNAAADDLSSLPSGNYPNNPPDNSCVQNNYYHISVTHRPSASSSQDYFDFIVRWDGIGGLGRQQEELSYKISAITAPPGF